MSKKKTKGRKTAVAAAREQREADWDADLDAWRVLMLDTYLPNVGSEAERRHVNMHINLTAKLTRELRAIRRAIEGTK